MPFSNSSLSAQVKSYLTFLPEEIRQKILEHLHGVIHYEPVIGIMGKSGTGKSSLCNAIFQSRICATHPLNGCTRQAHRLTLQLGERRMTLVDLPGIGETPQHDQEYRTLYRQLLCSPPSQAPSIKARVTPSIRASSQRLSFRSIKIPPGGKKTAHTISDVPTVWAEMREFKRSRPEKPPDSAASGHRKRPGPDFGWRTGRRRWGRCRSCWPLKRPVGSGCF